MKRICLLAMLTMLASPAFAGGSISFTVGGHRVQIDASRYCRSTSCASVSISGTSRKYVRQEDFRETPAPVNAAPPPSPSPAVTAPAPVVVAAPPPPVYRPAAVVTQTIAAPPPPPSPVQPVAIPLPPPPPPPPLPVIKTAEPPRPQILNVTQRVEEEPADLPVGDWQNEAKGMVRITKCGNALCGYVLNSASSEKGEAILVNMKPKTERQWTGSVYSQDSGDTYYGTINMKGLNTLRVEACAIGRFYCSGNNWIRVGGQTGALITSRQTASEPRS